MKTTTKQIKNKLHDHIAEYFGEDMGWPTNDYRANVAEQMTAQLGDKRLMPYTAGLSIVDGGTLLVYHGDVVDFLDGLDLDNPSGKAYTDEQSWKLYRHLMAREMAQIYNEAQNA